MFRQSILMRRDNDPMAIAARALMVAVILMIAFASLSPVAWIPHVLYSYHLEHFAAFYIVTLIMVAARYRATTLRVLIDVCALATLLEGLRLFIPLHQLSVVEDWVCDIGGALAAVSPVVVAGFRRSFQANPDRQGDAPV